MTRLLLHATSIHRINPAGTAIIGEGRVAQLPAPGIRMEFDFVTNWAGFLPVHGRRDWTNAGHAGNVRVLPGNAAPLARSVHRLSHYVGASLRQDESEEKAAFEDAVFRLGLKRALC
jgi:hypothetical protein